jgi:hypothetical protein
MFLFAIKTIYHIFAESNKKTVYNMNLENLFKIKNVADYMRCSPTWVMKLIKAGKLEHVKIDGAYFVVLTGEELEKYKEFRKEFNELLGK